MYIIISVAIRFTGIVTGSLTMKLVLHISDNKQKLFNYFSSSFNATNEQNIVFFSAVFLPTIGFQ